jgi:transposase
VAKVVIGVDPHKRLNAVVVLNHRGKVLARRQFPNTSDGFRELAAFSHRWRPRTWAIEGCNGVGKHVAQRLVAAGERVLDVSTRRAALVRVFAGGNGRKNDDVDAHSIALVGLHTPDLPEVRADDRRVALRLVSNRRKELIDLRTQCVNRLHRDQVALLPGGGPCALTVKNARAIRCAVAMLAAGASARDNAPSSSWPGARPRNCHGLRVRGPGYPFSRAAKSAVDHR